MQQASSLEGTTQWQQMPRGGRGLRIYDYRVQGLGPSATGQGSGLRMEKDRIILVSLLDLHACLREDTR